MIKQQLKKLSISIRILLVAVLTFTLGLTAVSFFMKNETKISFSKEISEQVFLVKIPPIVNKNSSDKEIMNYWLAYGTLPIPLSEIRKRNLSLPNSCGHLMVRIENDGKIKLYSEAAGNLEDLTILEKRLETIFRERTENGVFESDSSPRIFKQVLIRASLSAKYGDVIKVIDVVKKGGADPIVLMFDESSEID